MFQELMKELKKKDQEINTLVNAIHSEILKLGFDFKPLVRFDSNYGDGVLFVDMVFYNRLISFFRISYDEDSNSYRLERFDKNTSDYNTNGDYIPVVNDLNKLEKEISSMLSKITL